MWARAQTFAKFVCAIVFNPRVQANTSVVLFVAALLAFLKRMVSGIARIRHGFLGPDLTNQSKNTAYRKSYGNMASRKTSHVFFDGLDFCIPEYRCRDQHCLTNPWFKNPSAQSGKLHRTGDTMKKAPSSRVQ
jgi:hypothetical protein